MDGQKITIDISTGSILKIFGAILLVIFLYVIRDVIAIFLIALIIVTALSPIITKLQRFKIPRSVSMLTFYFLFFGLIGLLIYSIAPQIGNQIKEMANDVPRFADQLSQTFGGLPNYQEISQGFGEGIKNLEKDLAGSAVTIFPPLFRVFGGFVIFFIILMLTLYMSVAEDEIKKFFQFIFPKRYEKRVEQSIEKVQKKIGEWVRGEIILMFSIGILTYIGLTILGVKFALTLAIIAGLLELIPFLGPTISAIPAVFIAFTQTPVLGLVVIFLYILIQQFENHVLVPVIMKRTTGLSPVVTVLSLLIGAKLMGLLGVFLSVPVAVILSVFVEDIEEKQSIAT